MKKFFAILFLSMFSSLFVIIGGVIFVYHDFYVSINTPNNGKEFEYGDTITLDIPTVTLNGKHIFTHGIDMSEYLCETDNIDKTTLGTYKISYNAEYLFWANSTDEYVSIIDTVLPTIKLVGNPTIELSPIEEYTEEGYVAIDNYDGDITDKVVVTRNENTITYSVKDSSGNEATISRTLTYVDRVAPVIELSSDKTVSMYLDEKYKEIDFTATDDCDGDITDKVQVDLSNVNFEKAGTYTIKYVVSDSFNNTTVKERTLTIKERPKGTTNKVNDPTKTDKIIYLTFDDGPSAYTSSLLKVLDKYNVKATFFVVNTRYIDVIKEIHNQGHSIGIHCYTHDYSKIYKSKEAYYEDLYKMQEVIYNQTGVNVDILRFPGGSSNKVSKKYCEGIMSELTQDVIDKGFQYFDWNVSSGDAGSTTSTEQVYKNVINGIKSKSVAVVLQHDIKKFSVDAVEDIIIWGLENGYSFQALTKDSFAAHHGVNN